MTESSSSSKVEALSSLFPPNTDVQHVHAAEESLHYLEQHKISPIFEFMTASLLYHKPENMKTFLVDELKKLKTGKVSSLYTDEDLEGVFTKFDVTLKGSISDDQCKQALKSMGAEQFIPKEVPAQLNMKQFKSIAAASLQQQLDFLLGK